MSDEIMLVFGEDGVAREYDDTWDITIHCESEEEQKTVWEKLNNSNQEDCNELAKGTNVPIKDAISRQDALDALGTITMYKGSIPHDTAVMRIEQLPPAQPEWNNHTVACMLAELFDDTCACNYNGIDEWLPEKCEVIDACPNPVGVACWEQFLKHRAERRTDEED